MIRANKRTYVKVLSTGGAILLLSCAHQRVSAHPIDARSLVLFARLIGEARNAAPHRMLLEIVNCSSDDHRINASFAGNVAISFRFQDGSGIGLAGAGCTSGVERVRQRTFTLAPRERWGFECELDDAVANPVPTSPVQVSAQLSVDGAEQELVTSMQMHPTDDAQPISCRVE